MNYKCPNCGYIAERKEMENVMFAILNVNGEDRKFNNLPAYLNEDEKMKELRNRYCTSCGENVYYEETTEPKIQKEKECSCNFCGELDSTYHCKVCGGLYYKAAAAKRNTDTITKPVTQTEVVEMVEENKAGTSESVSLENLGSAGGYLSFPEGTTLEIKVVDYKKITGKEIKGKPCVLSATDYCFELEAESGKLTVNAWSLHGALVAAFKKAGKIPGAKLKISHPARGKYTAEVVA